MTGTRAARSRSRDRRIRHPACRSPREDGFAGKRTTNDAALSRDDTYGLTRDADWFARACEGFGQERGPATLAFCAMQEWWRE